MAALVVTAILVLPIVLWVVVGNRFDRTRAARVAAGEEPRIPWWRRHRRAIRRFLVFFGVVPPVAWLYHGAAAPDLEAKLAGEQSRRGWGLFLIEHMVDDMRVDTDGQRRTLSLVFDLERSQ